MVNYSTAQLDDTFFALSHPYRRQALLQLQAGPKRLIDLSRFLKISLPALHRHIDVLERANLISKRRVGRERFIMANLENIQTADEWITHYTKFWSNQFQSLDSYIQSLEGKNG